MTREFEALHPEAPVEEVVRRLKVPDADPIPVCDGNRLIGMVSYRDVAAGVAAAVRRGGSVRARDVVAQDIIYCLETTTVGEAAALMRENDVRVVPVLNAERRMVGILHMAKVPADLAPSDTAGAHDPGGGPTHLRL
jgi:CBS domain-containing protein